MAAINDLISQITDESLKKKLEQEVNKLSKQKKFGLVFESHLPEVTPLYDMPIKRGCKVMLKDRSEDKNVYSVLSIENGNVVCGIKAEEETKTLSIDDVVRVAEFGESIYPYLKPIDDVCNSSEDDFWHTLIEADNYHALQLLEYLYAGKVDCIYIDPPYNTGAKDWKYNNDYVDGNDVYRHSKWLSFIERRLKLAKNLLNPSDSVLIITIDEKEYLHLGCLLEEMFPDARIQMITSCINPNGAARSKIFTRVDEYIFFVMIGDSEPALSSRNMLDKEVETKESVNWFSLTRTGSNSLRQHSENCFYPIYVNETTLKIEGAGTPPGRGNKRDDYAPEGCVAIWPMHGNGNEGVWQVGLDELYKRLEIGAIRVGKARGKYSITYLRQGQLKEIEDGKIAVVGRDDNGVMILKRVEDQMVQARTMWNQSSHDATTFGSKLLKQILKNDATFKYPKSLYAVKDTIGFFVKNKKDALIVDFFAGSGTTMHAVNLLNSEDDGQRRCIMVTNNEISGEEAKALESKGYKPGDIEWESLGIAKSVTWPRTVCCIKGVDIKNQPLNGKYLDSEVEMKKGFRSNCIFFKLGFLDKTAVALGMQFKELLPILWMKAGAQGRCPNICGDELPKMLILPQNKFAVLIDENNFAEFENLVKEHSEIQTVYIVTDYEVNYRSMVRSLNVKDTYQLYRDYLDNFRINHGRN